MLFWNLDNNSLGVFIRGRGPIQIVAIVLDDFYAKSILEHFTNSLCEIISSQTSTIFGGMLNNQARIYTILNYLSSDYISYIKSINPDALLIFGSGTPRIVVFSPNTLSPRLFDGHALDESVKKFDFELFILYKRSGKFRAFLNQTMNKIFEEEQCVESLLTNEMASSIENMQLASVFELGISIGCMRNNSSSDLKKIDAALAGVFEVR